MGHTHTAVCKMVFRQIAQRADARIQGMLGPKMLATWNSPTGPKTIFFYIQSCLYYFLNKIRDCCFAIPFYCGIAKWLLVFAGPSDMMRPAHALSLKQNTSLAVTGAIWTRYCFVVTPRIYVLGACNATLSVVGLVQLARIAVYEQTKDKEQAVSE